MSFPDPMTLLQMALTVIFLLAPIVAWHFQNRQKRQE